MEGTILRDPKSGTQYEIVRFLREGGFGAVYRAKILDTEADVAIKAIDKAKLCDEKLKTVKNEIKIQSRLEHPSVVKLLNCFESEDHVFLVLEYFFQGDLEQCLMARKNDVYSEAEARHILLQLCSGNTHY